jgi:hypothetical protein
MTRRLHSPVRQRRKLHSCEDRRRTPWSLTINWQVTPWLKLLAGISNLTDRNPFGEPALEPHYRI